MLIIKPVSIVVGGTVQLMHLPDAYHSLLPPAAAHCKQDFRQTTERQCFPNSTDHLSEVYGQIKYWRCRGLGTMWWTLRRAGICTG